MTNTQLALLLTSIWLAPHAGERYSMFVSLMFLFVAIYLGWLK